MDIEEDFKIKILHSIWMATRTWYSDSLPAGRSGDRIPVRSKFSSVQADLGTHPVSSTVRAGSFAVRKRPGRCVYHPPLSSAKNKERAEL
jgi:hypothetical protein